MRVSIDARLWWDPKSGSCNVEERVGAGPAAANGAYSPVASATPASLGELLEETDALWPAGSPGQAPAGGEHDAQQPLELPLPQPAVRTLVQRVARIRASQELFMRTS